MVFHFFNPDVLLLYTQADAFDAFELGVGEDLGVPLTAN